MRRSSMMMNPIKMSKDPRPLKNKEWVSGQIESLIQYLCQHGYDSSMLSPKELNPPSTKNFQYICCFLFQQIDPTFDIQGTHFEEECIAFFEKLGYPFKINKSSMRCIAPHSWPPLLGAVSWLLELLCFAESFDDDGSKEDEESESEDVEMGGGGSESAEMGGAAKSEKSDRLFLNLVASNYGHWLEGTEDDESITQRMMDVFVEEMEHLAATIEGFEKANRQLVTEKERIEKNSPSILALQDTRQKLMRGKEEMKKCLEQRAEYMAKLKDKYHAVDTKLNEKVVKIQDAEAQIGELKGALSRQTISAKDVEQMNRESALLNQETDELGLQRQEIERKQYDVTEGINEVVKQIKQQVLEYNDLAQKIEIIPISAKYSFQQDHTLRLLDHLEARGAVNKATDLCNQDLQYFANNLQKLAAHYEDKLRKAAAQIKGEQDRIQQIHLDLEIEHKEVEILNKRLNNVQERYNEEKKKMSYLTANTAASIEQIELDLREQSEQIDHEFRLKNEEFAAVKRQHNKLQEECSKIEIELTSKIGIAIEKLIKHRAAVRGQIKAVNKTLDHGLHKMSFYHIQEPTIHDIRFNPDDTDVEMRNH